MKEISRFGSMIGILPPPRVRKSLLRRREGIHDKTYILPTSELEQGWRPRLFAWWSSTFQRYLLRSHILIVSLSQDATRMVQYKERPRALGAGKKMGSSRVSGEMGATVTQVCALGLQRQWSSVVYVIDSDTCKAVNSYLLRVRC